MKDTAKMLAVGILASALLVTVIALGIPAADAIPTFANQTLKGNTDDKPILTGNETIDATATYVYRDVEGEEHSKNITAMIDDVGATTHAFDPDVVTMGVNMVDVGALSPDPDYESDFDHYVQIKTQIPSNILYEETVTSACFGFVLERGDSDLEPDVQSYKVEIGAGDAVLESITVSGDADTGDADTTKRGECKGADDEEDARAEYEVQFSLNRIRQFLLDAYVREDAKDVASLYVKVYGPRAMASGVNETEDGDAFDVALQFYSWDGRSIMTYEAAAAGQILVGVTAGLVILVMGKSVSLRDFNPFARRGEVKQ